MYAFKKTNWRGKLIILRNWLWHWITHRERPPLSAGLIPPKRWQRPLTEQDREWMLSLEDEAGKLLRGEQGAPGGDGDEDDNNPAQSSSFSMGKD